MIDKDKLRAGDEVSVNVRYITDVGGISPKGVFSNVNDPSNSFYIPYEDVRCIIRPKVNPGDRVYLHGTRANGCVIHVHDGHAWVKHDADVVSRVGTYGSYMLENVERT